MIVIARSRRSNAPHSYSSSSAGGEPARPMTTVIHRLAAAAMANRNSFIASPGLATDDGDDRAILVQGDEGPAQSLPQRRLGSFSWGIAALHRLDAATMVTSPRRLPHTSPRWRKADSKHRSLS